MALALYDRSLNNLEATMKVADLYYTGGESMPGNPTRAYPYYHRAANVQNMLQHNTSEGVDKDTYMAKIWLELAAMHDYKSAHLELARFYYSRIDGLKGYHFALQHFEKYPDDPLCQLGMAKLYHTGYKEFAADWNLALSFYRQAANAGESVAMHRLGSFYSKGELGLGVDFAQAVNWFEMARSQRYVKPIVAIALMHFHGKGVTKSNKEAFKYYPGVSEIDSNDPANEFAGYYYKK